MSVLVPLKYFVLPACGVLRCAMIVVVQHLLIQKDNDSCKATNTTNAPSDKCHETGYIAGLLFGVCRILVTQGRTSRVQAESLCIPVTHVRGLGLEIIFSVKMTQIHIDPMINSDNNLFRKFSKLLKRCILMERMVV